MWHTASLNFICWSASCQWSTLKSSFYSHDSSLSPYLAFPWSLHLCTLHSAPNKRTVSCSKELCKTEAHFSCLLKWRLPPVKHKFCLSQCIWLESLLLFSLKSDKIKNSVVVDQGHNHYVQAIYSDKVTEWLVILGMSLWNMLKSSHSLLLPRVQAVISLYMIYKDSQWALSIHTML